VKKTAGGIGTAILFAFLFLVMTRNKDGDWFTPNKDRADLVVPSPDDMWNTAELVEDAQQVLVVASDSWSSTTAEVALFEKSGETWKRVYDKMPARIGRSGMKRNRSEGDGSTPAGDFPIGRAFGSVTKIDTKLGYTQLTAGSCWISTKGVDYNRWTTRTPCNPPDVDLYAGRKGPFEHAAVIDFNPQRVSGLGSALFIFQQASTDTASTSGSVALGKSNLLKVLSRLDSAKQPRIIIGPADWLDNGPNGSTTTSGWSSVKSGSTGDQVTQVQYALTAAGYSTKVDSIFAEETEANVRKFQADRKLKVDGIVGTETARALGILQSGS
jgi:L,D-peptidoglycan transpeptidase YkuD (ErfK/YbiS/YcfS/YnhG family)